MRINNNKVLILIVAILLGLMASRMVAADIPFGHGLLFKVTSPKGEVGHVFGTMHSEDPRVLKLPKPVASAFKTATLLALEVKMDAAVMVASMSAMINADGRMLEEILGSELYKRVVLAAETIGIPEIALRQYKPWAVATLLSVPPSQTGQFLDIVLFQQALQRGTGVVGLETVEEQLSLFDDLSEADQIAFLEDALNLFPELPMIHEKLLAKYLQRDLLGLVDMNDRLSQGANQEVARKFQDALLDQRNLRMADRMEAQMQNGLFVAVGALHLPGEQGLLNLLKQRGYTVERVY